MNVALFVAGILVAFGLVGIVLPVLPGVPLVFGGLLVAAWSDGFERVGAFTIVVLALLTAASVALDVASAAFAARKLGASRKAALGAALGTLVALPFGLLGLAIGPFAGAALFEYGEVRDWKKAGTAGAGGWLGLALAIAARCAVAFAMIGLFILAWFL